MNESGGETCSRCNGRGWVVVYRKTGDTVETCATCKGTGRIERED